MTVRTSRVRSLVLGWEEWTVQPAWNVASPAPSSKSTMGKRPLAHQPLELDLRLVRDCNTEERPFPVRARGEAHRPHVARSIDERHPERDSMRGVERPVDLVLMPWGGAPAGGLEKGLVVVEAHAGDAHEVRRGLREPPGKHERLEAAVQPPDVCDLREEPPVPALPSLRAPAARTSPERHPGSAGGTHRLPLRRRAPGAGRSRSPDIPGLHPRTGRACRQSGHSLLVAGGHSASFARRCDGGMFLIIAKSAVNVKRTNRFPGMDATSCCNFAGVATVSVNRRGGHQSDPGRES